MNRRLTEGPWLLFFFVLAGCTRSSIGRSEGSLAAKGKMVYIANCTACHNIDPKKDGSVGPAVWGASLELVEARVLSAQYPSAYSPKRSTHQMPALPHLRGDIPALHAFLNSNP